MTKFVSIIHKLEKGGQDIDFSITSYEMTKSGYPATAISGYPGLRGCLTTI
ncbi:MAG: hypothetical protein WAK17_15050 [Candidatus Nitrosopolaris sp.]|jgi:hypothetical protein